MAMRFSKISFVALHVDKESHHERLIMMLKKNLEIYICSHIKIAIYNEQKWSGDSVVMLTYTCNMCTHICKYYLKLQVHLIWFFCSGISQNSMAKSGEL